MNEKELPQLQLPEQPGGCHSSKQELKFYGAGYQSSGLICSPEPKPVRTAGLNPDRSGPLPHNCSQP